MKEKESKIDLEFTGERIVPGKVEKDLYHEHIVRYLFALQYVKDKFVLDAGCGVGYGAQVLLRGGCSRIVGVDISEEAINYARTHYKERNIEFMVGDCTKTSFPDRHFDIVVSFEVLEHIENYEMYLSEVKRILKNDGLFIVSTPNKKTYSDEQEGYKNPFHVREFYLEEFYDLLHKYFPSVKMLGENLSQGLLIRELQTHDRDRTEIDSGNLSDQCCIDSTHEVDRVKYYIAVCRMTSSTKDRQGFFYLPGESDALKRMTLWAKQLDKEVNEGREHVAKLQKEFDERTAWALNLDRELKDCREYVGKLQKECEERTEWALRLDKELKERDEIIRSLQQRLTG
jgi:ubiquinone/menaquinone biosynthesis C-methylase UbiE